MIRQAEQIFLQASSDYGLDLSPEQLRAFANYYELLLDWNQRINLTAITEAREVYIKHFFDSLTLAKVLIDLDRGKSLKASKDSLQPESLVQSEQSVQLNQPDQVFAAEDISKLELPGKYLIDIGSGAGFPGIPLKIFFPHLQVTFLDSLNKRISFLRAVCEELGLEGVNFVHGRAEDYGQDPKYREVYDFVTARAVAKLSVLNELASPFLRQGGYFLAMKGPDGDQELLDAENSIRLLNLQLARQDKLDLAHDLGQRQIICLQKRGTLSKKYPRKAGTPARKPL